MKPRVKLGLIVGAIGLVLNICVSAFVGFCGPVFSLVAGGVAGFLAAQQEKLGIKSEGARAGATAGGIAGGLMILGQLLGGIGTLVYFQMQGADTLFGAVPTGGSSSVGYYLGGLATGLCFGLIGAALAAGTGAGAGYFATQEGPAQGQPPSNDPVSM
ncbi:MAG: hypothetical protein U0V48_08355 [Anaerolineales bacterium]